MDKMDKTCFTIFILCLIGLFLVGCAPASGDNDPITSPPTTISCRQMAGTYDNNHIGGATMVISNTCHITDSVCGYDADFTEPMIADGSTTLVVHNTNGTPGCMLNRPHPCFIEIQGNQLGISCDNNTQTAVFTKR